MKLRQNIPIRIRINLKHQVCYMEFVMINCALLYKVIVNRKGEEKKKRKNNNNKNSILSVGYYQQL